MRLFKKSGRKQNNESILRQRYSVFFSSERLVKGISLTFIGWVLIAVSTVAFQHLVINNSIYVTLFYIFSAAFVPLFICALFKGRGFFICGKPYFIIIRAIFAVGNYYTYFTSRIWITKTSNSLLFSIDTLCVPLLVYLIFKKKFSSLTWIGLLTSFFGLALVYSFKLDIFSMQGILESTVCLVSGVTMAGLIIISCYIIRYDSALRQSLYTTLFGAVVSGIGAWTSGWKQPCNADIVYMLIQGLFYAAVIMLFLSACDCIEPHIVANLSHCVPLLIIFLNGAFKFYPISFLTYIGTAVTMLGMLAVLFSTRFQRKEEDLLLS
ncbi:MAG: hypothetical protein S4CHLAM6_09870 [Chlamydiae bacterium]|nr:hypothetical protein [Chlamydiota bacterium]